MGVIVSDESMRAFAFTFQFVGHGYDQDDALRDVTDNNKVSGLTVDMATEVEDLGELDPGVWAIYCPSEQGWWNDDTGWGALETARTFSEAAVSADPDGPHLVQPDAMYVRVGGCE